MIPSPQIPTQAPVPAGTQTPLQGTVPLSHVQLAVQSAVPSQSSPGSTVPSPQLHHPSLQVSHVHCHVGSELATPSSVDSSAGSTTLHRSVHAAHPTYQRAITSPQLSCGKAQASKYCPSLHAYDLSYTPGHHNAHNVVSSANSYVPLLNVVSKRFCTARVQFHAQDTSTLLGGIILLGLSQKKTVATVLVGLIETVTPQVL